MDFEQVLDHYKRLRIAQGAFFAATDPKEKQKYFKISKQLENEIDEYLGLKPKTQKQQLNLF